MGTCFVLRSATDGIWLSQQDQDERYVPAQWMANRPEMGKRIVAEQQYSTPMKKWSGLDQQDHHWQEHPRWA